MITWQTDNEISHVVARATGYPINHINDFNNTPIDNAIFYGILRGNSRAMHILQYLGIDYYYIDNGYYGAQYIDEKFQKQMDGYYRVVKNDMIEPYNGILQTEEIARDKVALILPPSIHTANFYNTIPADWLNMVCSQLYSCGYRWKIREKSAASSLKDDLKGAGIVIVFNSMAAMQSIELGIPTYDSHGIFRNIKDIKLGFKPKVIKNIKDIKTYYTQRQFTLSELKDGVAKLIKDNL